MALAKITRPRTTSAVPRARLFQRLDQARNSPITWVWAPPGSGKTTTVSSYLAARKLSTLWFQVDPGDSDLATFFYYLGLAVPKRKRPMPLFTAEYRQGAVMFARNFFRELCRRLKPPFALVFDNYQELPDDAALHALLREAVAEIPQGGRAIFISRSDPPTRFAYLRAQQALTVVDWLDLRFTLPEARELIRSLSNPGLSPGAIQSLHEWTDGWAAGMILLSEQQSQRHQAISPSAQASKRVLFDYFAGEVFKTIDQETRNILLRSAYLPHMTETAVAKLTGQASAGQVLVELHKKNYFTNRRQTIEPVYEYHPLFREFLLSESDKVFTQDELTTVRLQAAQVAEANGQTEAAAELLRDTEAWGELTRLICQQAPTLLAQGRTDNLERWIASMPTEIVEATPWLLFWRGTCRLGIRHEECRANCIKAFHAFRQGKDAAGVYLAWSVIVTSFNFEGPWTPLDPWIALFDDLRREFPEVGSPAIEQRLALALSSALLLRQPRHPEIEYWMLRALELAKQHNDPVSQSLASYNWFRQCWAFGARDRAAQTINELRHVWGDLNAPAMAQLIAGIVLLQDQAASGDLTYRDTVAAIRLRQESLGIFQPFDAVRLLCAVAAALNLNELETATPWIEELAAYRTYPSPGVQIIYYWKTSWFALIRGEVDRAVELAPQALACARDCGFHFPLFGALVLNAEVCHHAGKDREALGFLEETLALANEMNNPHGEFMARVTLAEIYFDAGQQDRGLVELGIALSLGRSCLIVSTFTWIPAVMARLCAKALEAGIEVDYVKHLIAKKRLVPDEASIAIEAWPWPVKIYTLGQFKVLKDDQPLVFGHKAQRKPLALLKAIIAFGGHAVREDQLLDLLWPDADGDSAADSLNMAAHRLRKLLGREDALIREENQFTLNQRVCWVDVAVLDQLLGQIETLLNRDKGHEHRAQATQSLDRALDLYKGPFLSGDRDIPTSPLTDRMRRRLLRQVSQLGQQWEWHEDFEQAALLYERGLGADPCAEELGRHLMTAYHRLGKSAEIRSTYDALAQALKHRLDLAPSAETEGLMKRLMAR